MTKQHNRRQRKKLHLREFVQLGFALSARFAAPLTDERGDRLLDDFIEDCIEPLGLRFGGGLNDDLSGYVTSAMRGRSASENQRDGVLAWLSARREFTDIDVGPLSDAWKLGAGGS